MKKTMNNETRANKAIRMINREGATWEDVAKVLQLSVSYCRKIVKDHYKSETAYNKMLAKARRNQKLKQEVEVLISVEIEADKKEVNNEAEVEKQELKQVVVVETGYLLDVGIQAISEETLDMFMPAFNLKELDKLTRSIQVAEEILMMFYATHKITAINLRGDEELLQDPVEPVKARTVGIVALCCHLWLRGYRVILKTNSQEVERLAKQQGIGIDVIRVKKPNLQERFASVE